MTNVSQLHDAGTIEDQAVEWLVRLDSEDATPNDREEFERWQNEDPRRRQAVERHQRQLARFDGIDRSLLKGAAARPDPDIVIKRQLQKGRFWHSKTATGAAAAALLLAALVGWLALYQTLNGPTHRTGIGEQSAITLPDGSVVELNTDSVIAVRYSDLQRVVELRRGEAHFDVVRDVERPFIVVAGDSRVRAVGTAFNVLLRDVELEVTVTEGRVEVTSGAALNADRTVPDALEYSVRPRSVAITQGQQAEVSEATTSVAAVDPDVLDRKLAWRRGMLIFEGETLGEVVQELARYTDLRLVIVDDNIAELQVGAYFRADDIEAGLDMIATSLSIYVQRTGSKTVTLSKEILSENG